MASFSEAIKASSWIQDMLNCKGEAGGNQEVSEVNFFLHHLLSALLIQMEYTFQLLPIQRKGASFNTLHPGKELQRVYPLIK